MGEQILFIAFVDRKQKKHSNTGQQERQQTNQMKRLKADPSLLQRVAAVGPQLWRRDLLANKVLRSPERRYGGILSASQQFSMPFVCLFV